MCSNNHVFLWVIGGGVFFGSGGISLIGGLFWVPSAVDRVRKAVCPMWSHQAMNKGPKLLIERHHYSLSQWLNFKLLGITYLVGKIKFKLFFPGSIG